MAAGTESESVGDGKHGGLPDCAPTRKAEGNNASCCRPVAARIGGDVAAFATAGKPATYLYHLLRWGQQQVMKGPKLSTNAAASGA
jgi:hypothetical protein